MEAGTRVEGGGVVVVVVVDVVAVVATLAVVVTTGGRGSRAIVVAAAGSNGCGEAVVHDEMAITSARYIAINRGRIRGL